MVFETIESNVRDHVLVLLKHPALDQADAVAKLNMRNFHIFRSLLIVLSIVIVQLAVELVRVDLSEFHSLKGRCDRTLGPHAPIPRTQHFKGRSRSRALFSAGAI